MLNGIIINDDVKYKVIVKEDKFLIKKYSSKKVKYLNKEEAVKLLNEIFSGEKNLLKKENGYEIFLDEAGNKRYFKNGIENYKLFFLNNGVDALMYYNKDKKNDNKKPTVKRFLIGNANKFVLICTMTFCSIISYYGDPQVLNMRYILNEPIAEITIDDKLSTEEVMNSILNSNGKNITEQQKQELANEDFIDLVLDTAGYSRYYDLKDKTTDIGVYYFSDDSNGDRPNRDGYYDSIVENHLYLYDNAHDGTLIHEFVHLMQSDNAYYYVREACAELMCKEFYDYEIKTYTEQVKRICILMEIIGPEPILECNFKGYTGNFENAIIDILGKEEGEELLKLLMVAPLYNKDTIKETNQKIDEYLDKMYEIVYSDDINNNMIINDLREKNINDVLDKRIYFNKNNIDYYTNYHPLAYIDEKEEFYFPDLDYSEIEKIFVYKRDVYTHEEYKRMDKYEKNKLHMIPNVREDDKMLFGTEAKKEELESLEDMHEILYDEDPHIASIRIIFKDGFEAKKYSGGRFIKNIYYDHYPSIYSLFDKDSKVKKL